MSLKQIYGVCSTKKTSVIVLHLVLQGNGILRGANCKLIICTLTELFVTSQRAMPCKRYGTLGIYVMIQTVINSVAEASWWCLQIYRTISSKKMKNRLLYCLLNRSRTYEPSIIAIVHILRQCLLFSLAVCMNHDR